MSETREAEKARKLRHAAMFGGMNGSQCHAITKNGWQCGNYPDDIRWSHRPFPRLCRKHREMQKRGEPFELIAAPAASDDDQEG